MIESHAVLEISYGVLDLGVAAMIGLQLQGVAISIGDEGVIAVAVAKRASWEPGVGLTRRTMSRTGLASGSVRKGM